MFSVHTIALVAAAATAASVRAQDQIERIPLVLPVGPIPAGERHTALRSEARGTRAAHT